MNLTNIVANYLCVLTDKVMHEKRIFLLATHVQTIVSPPLCLTWNKASEEMQNHRKTKMLEPCVKNNETGLIRRYKTFGNQLLSFTTYHIFFISIYVVIHYMAFGILLPFNAYIVLFNIVMVSAQWDMMERMSLVIYAFYSARYTTSFVVISCTIIGWSSCGNIFVISLLCVCVCVCVSDQQERTITVRFFFLDLSYYCMSMYKSNVSRINDNGDIKKRIIPFHCVSVPVERCLRSNVYTYFYKTGHRETDCQRRTEHCSISQCSFLSTENKRTKKKKIWNGFSFLEDNNGFIFFSLSRSDDHHDTIPML